MVEKCGFKDKHWTTMEHKVLKSFTTKGTRACASTKSAAGKNVFVYIPLEHGIVRFALLKKHSKFNFLLKLTFNIYFWNYIVFISV